MDYRLQHGFRLGEFEVWPLEGRIIGSTGSQHVQPRVMEVLLCLASKPGDLVSRDSILSHCWGGDNGSAEALTRSISDLRRYLDDHKEAVRYIQTIPKRGYRLVAEVELIDGDKASAGEDHISSGTEQPNFIAAFWEDLKRRNVVRVAIAYSVFAWLLAQVGALIFSALPVSEWALQLLLVLLALGFPVAIIIAWAFQVTPTGVVLDLQGAASANKNLRRNLDVVIISALVVAVGVLSYKAWVEDESWFEPEPVESTIAVLRFLNIGGEPHFADGLGEELLDRLANLNELGVAARTSSWALSDGEMDIPQIAEQLQVAYILEGSVRQAGGQIRVTAQLNDGKTGMHIWSHTYDRKLTTANFFATQADIAQKVVELLKISLKPYSNRQLTDHPETSIEALELYLQGRQYFREPHSDESLIAAADLFRDAIDLDPRFARAYAGLCDAGLGMFIISKDVSAFEEAERACHRALTLNPDSPAVKVALGGLYLFSGQYDKAEDQLRSGLGENSNLIDAYADLGETLEFQDNVLEAEHMFQTMIARQPGYWYAYNAYGNFLYRQSRFDEAVRSWQQVTRLAPEMALGYNNVAAASYMIGEFRLAAEAYEKSLSIEPYADNYSNLGLAYLYDGKFADAAKMQRKAVDLRPDRPRLLGRLATARYYAGEVDDATDLFRDAIRMIHEQLAINPNDIRLNRALAVYNSIIGEVVQAQEAINRALELQPDSAGVRFDAAKVELAAGNVDESLRQLEAARELGYSAHIIRADPYFRELHTDDRFQLVVADQ